MKSMMRKVIRPVLVAGALLLMSPGGYAQTQADVQARACKEYQEADSELNTVYKKVLSEYKSDKEFLQKLKKAQQAWIAYRDAHIESRYPAADKQAEYGTMYVTCLCEIQKELTVQRTDMLKLWLDGVKEGETCSGSVRAAP